MSTVGDLCTTIIGDLGRGDTSLSDVILIDIKSSVRDYEGQRFYFNEQLLTLTLSATDTYALSLWDASGSNVVDVIEPDFMEVVINSTRNYQLEEKTTLDLAIRSSNAQGIKGYPQYFSIWNQAVKIYPQANAKYTGRLWGHIKFTELAAMSDSNPWTNDASELIRNATLKRLWGRRFRDYDAAQACGVAEQEALRYLQRRTEALSDQRISGYL